MSSKLKTFAKQLVPERYRLLRYELYEKLRYYPELLFSLGDGLECMFCGSHFRRFLPAGFDYEVLRERKVIGASYHANDLCPRCKSNARERLVYLYLKNETSLFNDSSVRLLHMAPEPNLARVLGGLDRIKYVSADIARDDTSIKCDLLQMPFPKGTFDVIVCNHVLEHVSDDGAAMAELFGLLSPGGWAILQVPIALALKQTDEDPTVNSDEERIRRFGQRDHVRLYALNDYVKRLGAAGFFVRIEPYPRQLTPEIVARYGLITDEIIFHCSKRGT
jgi:SAM-dependent methyltransferase